MARSNARRKRASRSARRTTTTQGFKAVEYLLGKGTSRLLNARVDTGEIRLLVNGPTMLYGACRILTSLDAADGATYHAWNVLAAGLKCTSHCGLNGKTDIPIVVLPSRIGTCLEFGTGPMSMYLGTVVLRTKKRGTTFRQVIDDAFGNPGVTYQVLIVPEPATGHLEHHGAIFDPSQFPPNAPEPGQPVEPAPPPPAGHGDHVDGDHSTHVHRAPQPARKRRTGVV